MIIANISSIEKIKNVEVSYILLKIEQLTEGDMPYLEDGCLLKAESPLGKKYFIRYDISYRNSFIKDVSTGLYYLIAPEEQIVATLYDY